MLSPLWNIEVWNLRISQSLSLCLFVAGGARPWLPYPQCCAAVDVDEALDHEGNAY